MAKFIWFKLDPKIAPLEAKSNKGHTGTNVSERKIAERAKKENWITQGSL